MVCIGQIGIDLTDAFMRVTRPTIDKYLACHPSIRVHILSAKY